jgi:acetyl esterase/lipase
MMLHGRPPSSDAWGWCTPRPRTSILPGDDHSEAQLICANWFGDHYLRGTSDYADWRASPLRASRHSDLPPAYILTVGSDPILSEGEEYVRVLREAGVPVTHRHLPDQIHGFMTMGKFIAAAEIETKAAGMALGMALRASANDRQ